MPGVTDRSGQRLIRSAQATPAGWVEDRPGVSYSLVHVDIHQGLWVTKVKFKPGAVVPMHLHTGPVIGYTVRGSWGYPSDDALFQAGDYCLEVAGTYHQVEVPTTNVDDTEAIFLLWGALIIFKPGSREIIEYTDAATVEDEYLTLCKKQNVSPAQYIKI